MVEAIVRAGLVALAVYLVAGCLFAAIFHAAGLGRIDHAVDGSSLGFRLIITPGLVALWPLMWMRWRAGGASTWSQERPITPAALRRRHGRFIVFVLLVVLGIVIPALMYRPAEPVQHHLK